MKVTGRVWKLGDDVNTDLIIAGRYKYDTLDMKQLAKHAFEDLDPTLSSKIREGDIIVAGENFGCGSSREHAPLVIKALGVKAIVAESFARIFYRNAVNIGLMIVECKGVRDFVSEGEVLTIDFDRGELINESRGKKMKFKPVKGMIREILEAGGLINYLRRTGKLK